MIWLWLVIAAIVISFGLIVLRGAPYVPSHRVQLRRAFTELYPLGPDDTIVDLGSGDGIVLREARRHGAGAIGYELNPFLVLLSRLLSQGDDKVSVHIADYTAIESLPQGANVVYAFTTSHSIETVGRRCEQWSHDRKLYLISYGFTLAHKQHTKHVGPMYLYEFGAK